MKLSKLETYEGEAIDCVNADTEMLLKNVEVDMGDVLEVKEKQYLVLSRSGKVLDIASTPGFYKVTNGNTQNKEVEENWSFYKNRIQEKHCYYAFFINLSEIVRNESFISEPIIFKDHKLGTKYFVLKMDSVYNFEIVTPQNFMNNVVNLRINYSKQELMERITRYFVHAIELGLNKKALNDKWSLEKCYEKFDEIVTGLKLNEYSNELVDYGVRLTTLNIDTLEFAKRGRYKVRRKKLI
jgi:membrane protease subunit (stomatin/prohibitin family)